jgi:tRNA A-37 threonylcarbamoyl transferase component Bud32
VDEVEFGRYRLIEMIGEGGMGEVWRAHDTVTDRVVAIKVLPPKLSQDEDFQQRFRREALAAARLETPHVVPIHDYGEIDGRLFVCMRLIKGRDLATVLADGPLEPARAARIIGQVAEALHAAHEIGLIHRDIKPSNILLDENDFAYLIDFGIARAADETRMTKTGNTIGTFAYIAPERLDGRGDEDARVDIYSLACVLYECLAGAPPFGGDTMARLVAAHLNSPPPRPSIGRPDVSAAVDEVIATGMAKDPDERYATTVELADAAHRALSVPTAIPHADRTWSGTVASPTPRLVSFGDAPAPYGATENSLAAANTLAAAAAQYYSPPVARKGWSPVKVVATATAAVLIVVVVVAIGIKQGIKPAPAATVTTTIPSTAPTTTTPTPAPPVAEAALAGLLLSVDQVNATAGSTGQLHRGDFDQLFKSTDSPWPCMPLMMPGGSKVYAASGWTAVRGTATGEAARGSIQMLILFPTVQAARAFFADATQRWQACSGKGYKDDVGIGTLGSVSNIGNTLSATYGVGKFSDVTSGERALTVSNNVVIDILTRGAPNCAVSIAHQIAAKVPTT